MAFKIMKASDVGGRYQIWSVQYLRAIAAMAVIAFHLLPGIPLMWIGEYGVDLFFVISGFMMAIMTIGREISPTRFLLDRITRVVPLYWLATVLTVVGVLAGVEIFAASANLHLAARSLLFIPTYGERGHIWPTLYLGWTLNYEIFFYAIYAVCLLAPRGWKIPALSAALIALFLLGLLLEPAGAVPRTWTDSLLLEFVAGAWLGTIAGPRGDRFTPARMALLMLGIVLFMLAASLASPRLLFGTASALILAAALLAERQGVVPRIEPLKRLGDASYSIYLFQNFAFAAVAQTLAFASRHTGLRLDLVRFTAPLGFAAAVGLGYAVSLLVERPTTAWLRKKAGRVFHLKVRLS